MAIIFNKATGQPVAYTDADYGKSLARYSIAHHDRAMTKYDVCYPAENGGLGRRVAYVLPEHVLVNGTWFKLTKNGTYRPFRTPTSAA